MQIRLIAVIYLISFNSIGIIEVKNISARIEEQI